METNGIRIDATGQIPEKGRFLLEYVPGKGTRWKMEGAFPYPELTNGLQLALQAVVAEQRDFGSPVETGVPARFVLEYVPGEGTEWDREGPFPSAELTNGLQLALLAILLQELALMGINAAPKVLGPDGQPARF